MQWLIDIVKEWIIAQGYLTTSFVDRGDPENYDFLKASFTTDGNMHDLDLSSIVPSNAKAILFLLDISSPIIHREGHFLKKGNNWLRNTCGLFTQVSNVAIKADMVCPIGSDGYLQYIFADVWWNKIDFVVKGWWL